jgi:hypothetical protein
MTPPSIIQEIDEYDAGPARLTDMGNGLDDPGWRIPFGELEQAGFLGEPLRECNIGSPLFRRGLHPTAEHHAIERERAGRKQTDVARFAAE